MDCAHSRLCAASTPTTSVCTAARLRRCCRSRRRHRRWRNFTTRPSALPVTSLNGSRRLHGPRQRRRACTPDPTPTPADRSKQVCSDARRRLAHTAPRTDTIRYRVLGCRPSQRRRLGLEIDSAELAGRLHSGHSAILRPGGTEWVGSAADAASLRTDRDRVQVAGLADRLATAAAVADRGADDLLAAKRQAMTSIGNATWAGFHVSEDLSVRDTVTTASKPQRLIRDLQARVFAAEIKAGSLHLAATDQAVASKLNTFAAGFGRLPFPQGPTKEPAPPKVPMPPHDPRVWGACRLGGGDPDKVVRTFHRAPLVDGFSAMPGGDSVLYCGNEKFGFYHIVNRHGRTGRTSRQDASPAQETGATLLTTQSAPLSQSPKRPSTTRRTTPSWFNATSTGSRKAAQFTHSPAACWYPRRTARSSPLTPHRLRSDRRQEALS